MLTIIGFNKDKTLTTDLLNYNFIRMRIKMRKSTLVKNHAL